METIINKLQEKWDSDKERVKEIALPIGFIVIIVLFKIIPSLINAFSNKVVIDITPWLFASISILFALTLFIGLLVSIFTKRSKKVKIIKDTLTSSFLGIIDKSSFNPQVKRKLNESRFS